MDTKDKTAQPKPGGGDAEVRGRFRPLGEHYGTFDLSAARIVDSTAEEHQLISGITLKAGTIKLKNAKIDTVHGLNAVIISDDETVFMSASVESAVGSGATGLDPPVTWSFVWNGVPAMGLGFVRLTELTTDLGGAEHTFSAAFVEDPQTDPMVIGNPGPGP
jgi:hypothetical protein